MLASPTGRLSLWSIGSRTPKWSLKMSAAELLTFHPDGKLACVSGVGLSVLSVEDGRLEKARRLEKRVTAIASRSDDLYVGFDDGSLEAWDWKLHRAKKVRDSLGGEVTYVCPQAGSDRIAVVLSDGQVVLVDGVLEGEDLRIGSSDGHYQMVRFLNEGASLLASTDYGVVQVVDIRSKQEKWQWVAIGSPLSMTCCDLSRDEQVLAAGDILGEVRFWRRKVKP